MTSRKVFFKNDLEKLRWMNDGAARDAAHSEIQKLALQLVANVKPDDYAGMCAQIQNYVRDGIRYTHDPNRREKLMTAWDTLKRGADDCDGKARVAAALARAVGLEAVVWPKWRGPVLAHVQWAARYPGSARDPRAQLPAHGLSHPPTKEWIVGEVTIKGCAFGDDPARVGINPDTGKLPLA